MKKSNVLRYNVNNDIKFLLPYSLQSGKDYDILSRDKINEMFNKGNGKKILPSKYSKGYRGYEVFLIKEGIDSNQYDDILKCVQELIKGLEKGKVYSLLFSVINSENNKCVSLLPSALLVVDSIPIDILTKYLIQHMIIIESKYDVNSDYLLVIQGRVWLSQSEIINEIKSKKSKTKENISDKEISIESGKKFDSISEVVKDDLYSLLKSWNGKDDLLYLANLFKELKKKCLEIRLTPKKIDDLVIITGDYSYTLYLYKQKNNLRGRRGNDIYLLCLHHFDKNIYHVIEGSYIINTWDDVDLDGKFILRKYNNNKVLFERKLVNKGRKKWINIKEIELGYNFKSFKEWFKTHLIDRKIGVIDLETFSFNYKGGQQVYAGGWKVRDFRKLYYIDEYEKFDSVKLVKNLFLDILKSEYYDYTYFVHNLSGFDYIFILNALTSEDKETNGKEEVFKLKPIIKDDNTLVSLKISGLIVTEKKVILEDGKVEIKKIKKYRTITLLDSYLFLPACLRKLAKDFHCFFEKGYFPYKFVNKDTLLYKGVTPDYDYFTDLSMDEYKELFPYNYYYDVKSETMKYLNKDLSTLLEVMEEFSKIIHNEFGVNITSSKTISGLSLKIYLSNFYNRKFNIKEIKGGIEKEIRKAYYGGVVVLNKPGKIISKEKPGYYYDFNSFYPSLMLKSMPVGNPTLSSSKDLDSYFGFCYAEIIPPAGLENYLIPFRDKNGKVNFPSNPFCGIYWSELLKSSREYGYKIKVFGGYKFKKGDDIFTSFVNDIYMKRNEAKEEGLFSLQYVFKLILNSLYGRFGMKDIENKIEIVDTNEAEKILKKKNVSLYTELNNKSLIKYNTNMNINYKILNLVKDETSQDKIDLLANVIKQRGNSSSIPIAAAITSYAHMELMKYKNIKSNKLLYSDTDSLLMEKELDNNLISSNKLGKLKLEHIISEAYIIAPKLYLFIDDKGNIIMRHKGVRKGKLSYDDFVNLSEGKEIDIKNMVFIKNLKEGTVNIMEQNYNLKGIDSVLNK